MLIDKIDIKKLGIKYSQFLEDFENVGCPMLAEALCEVIGGKAIVGTFDGAPHCWVELKGIRYDLNNMVSDELTLLISTYTNDKYKALSENVKEFAKGLGFSESSFSLWVARFKKAMRGEMY
jgi:hypothetical protein